MTKPKQTLSEYHAMLQAAREYTGPRQRLPGEALPNTISYRAQPVYVPENLAPARANADHHMMFKSRGV